MRPWNPKRRHRSFGERGTAEGGIERTEKKANLIRRFLNKVPSLSAKTARDRANNERGSAKKKGMGPNTGPFFARNNFLQSDLQPRKKKTNNVPSCFLPGKVSCKKKRGKKSQKNRKL